MFVRLLLLTLQLGWTTAAVAQAPISPPPGYIGTWHEQRPTEVVRTFAGRCEGHNYLIVVRPASMGRLGLSQISVDGNPLNGSGLELVRKSIPERANLMDTSIKECRTNAAARLRLFAVNWEARPVEERFIDFTVDGRGRVQDLQPKN